MPWPQRPVKVPYYRDDLIAAVLRYEYPQFDDYTTGPITLSSDSCTDSLLCTFLYEPSDFDSKEEITYPCSMLLAFNDLCFGTFYCACQNGFWKEANSISDQSTSSPIKPVRREERGQSTVHKDDEDEMNVLRGAAIAATLAIFICSVPCVVGVWYIRKKRMNSEIDQL